MPLPSKSAGRGWKKTPEGWDHSDPRMQQIIFQIRADRPHADICAQFKISAPWVSQIRRRLGLPDKRFSRKAKEASASS